MKKGTITLSEGRSGSSWLCELCNSTGVLGKSSEWIDAQHVGVSPTSMSGEKYLDAVVDAGSTPNGFFALKIFPRHVHWFQIQYGFDLIEHLRNVHDVQLVVVERRDRIKQAISFSKALQTKSWSSEQTQKRTAQYDFDQICRCYFMVSRSYEFWKSYLDLKQLAHQHFFYEDMIPEPDIFVQTIAKHADVAMPLDYSTERLIQSDRTSGEWEKRFLDEALNKPFISASTPARPPRRTLSNLGRFLSRKPMKPFPFTF